MHELTLHFKQIRGEQIYGRWDASKLTHRKINKNKKKKKKKTLTFMQYNMHIVYAKGYQQKL